MRRVDDLIAHAAAADAGASVLVTGAAGTGKQHVARELHARSRRSAMPFVAVRCAALDDRALDVALFAPAEGAAVRRAAGGTIFIDDLGAMPAGAQIKLLGALQARTFDVRFVVATTVDPARLVEQGKLRAALHRRIDAIRIDLPALRDRREDVLPLARMFLDRAKQERSDEDALVLSAATSAALVAYDWPGNVSQLRDTIVDVAASFHAGEVPLDALPLEMRRGASEPPIDLASLPYREMLAATRDRSSRDYLSAVLRAVGGNVTQAAERAGIERESLHRLLKRYGLDANEFRPG